MAARYQRVAVRRCMLCFMLDVTVSPGSQERWTCHWCGASPATWVEVPKLIE